MAKYREKIPTMVVDIDEWDPENGKPHPAVAASRDVTSGRVVGTIHRTNGDNIVGILPGTGIITYPTNPPTYAPIKADEIDSYFDRIDAVPALEASNGDEALKLD